MITQNITIPIKELQRRIESVALRLPIIAGRIAVKFALDNFKNQRFLGETLQPWRPRKNPNKWGQTPPRNNRKILVDTGRLRRSIRIVSSTHNMVTIGSDVPYAKAHNEGVRLGEIQKVSSHTRKLNGIATVQTIKTKRSRKVKVQVGENTVKAHTRKINQKIPARPFLKDSPYLREKLSRHIAAEILRITR